MISNQSVQDFVAIHEGIVARAIAETQQRCQTSNGDMNARGVLHSSLAAQATDRMAVEAFEKAAAELFAGLRTLNDAEPTKDPDARRQQVLDLLESKLRELGAAVFVAREPYRFVCIEGLQNTSLLDDSLSRAVVDRMVGEYRGRLGLAVTTLGHASAARQGSHSINVTNHGSIANLQTGHGSTASVSQKVVTHVSSDEVKAALDLLIQALQKAHGVAPDQRSEVIEVLEQVKAEADNEKPNRLRIGGLLGSVGDVVQTIGAAPQAWETVLGWYEKVKALAGWGG